jgi:hypothetical protein
MEGLNVSEYSSDPANPGHPADFHAGAGGETSSNVESPRLAPDQELSAPPPDEAKPEAPKAEAPKVDAARADAPKTDTPRPTGHVMIMAPSRGESWSGATIDHEPAPKARAASSGAPGGSRLPALAAVAVIAAIAGALGGALATTGFGRSAASPEPQVAVSHAKTLQDTVTRLETEVATLKSNLDRASKGDTSQFARVTDRIDRIEKAQAEPAAKLAKLTETVEKMRVASAAATATQAAAKETTGSIPAAAAKPVPVPSPKPEYARLPTIEGWVLRDVANGGALIEGRQGIFEVYAGDPVPGLGRIDAIRKQDGRWVVVTNRGLIVAR